MHRSLKITLIILLVITLGLAGVCTLGYHIITGSLPQTEGTVTAAGLDRQTSVYRDGYSIPHIMADTEYSLFFTQGFVTAQDRLWQMDLWRRSARGRLASIFGEKALSADSLMLTVGIHRAAEKIAEQISAGSRSVYQAYTDGVNAYLAAQGEQLPVEFILLGYQPADWSVTDCIAVSRWFAWQLTASWHTDLTIQSIFNRVKGAKAAELAALLDIPPQSLRQTGSVLVLRTDSGEAGALFPPAGSVTGDNSWAVAGSRSATGLPLLANDLHLALSLPSTLYENHLFGAGYDVYGFSLPGLPGILIGHNRDIAWGMTGLMADDLDFFLEKPLPGNAGAYRYGGGTRKFREINEQIPVRLDTVRTIRILESIHGPVITELICPEPQEQYPVSLRWTGLDFGDDLKAILGINRAAGWQEFRRALSHFHIAPRQFIYADTRGHIGLQAAGTIPARSGSPFLFRDGSDPGQEWQGRTAFEDLPSLYDPPSGFLAAANHLPSGSRLPLVPSAPSRLQRINALLTRREFLSINDFKDIQSDVISPFALDLLKVCVERLEDKFRIGTTCRSLWHKMEKWDGAMHTGSAEAAFFHVFIHRLQHHIFASEFGSGLYRGWLGTGALSQQILHSLIQKGSSAWFSGAETGAPANDLLPVLEISFREAVDQLKEKLGEDHTRWSWGALHRLTLNHPLGSNPLIGPSFNLGPFPMGGSSASINGFINAGDEEYRILRGAGMRMITDMGRRDNSLSVLPAGQSGQPMDTHYKDQLVLYREHLYHPVLTDTTRIKRSGLDLLILRPGDIHE